MFGLGYTEMLLFGIIAIMLFGSRLPEVARSVGGSYRDLKKSVSDFQREFQNWDRVETKPKKPAYTPDDHISEATTPKFAPPPPDDNA